MGGLFDGIPVLAGVEDAAGTAATGAVDTLIADPGNALLGVNADNMGIFEEQAAGQKAVTIASLGLLGEGGLLTDILMPGQGEPGSEQGTGLDNTGSSRQTQDGVILTTDQIIVLGIIGLGTAYLLTRGET